jgi:hypothetical protein
VCVLLCSIVCVLNSDGSRSTSQCEWEMDCITERIRLWFKCCL